MMQGISCLAEFRFLSLGVVMAGWLIQRVGTVRADCTKVSIKRWMVVFYHAAQCVFAFALLSRG